jgi:hypothetical protein
MNARMKPLTCALAAAAIALGAAPANAGLILKAFELGSVVVGGVALSKSMATKHCSEHPEDPQCAKSVKGTDADPAIVAPKPVAPGAAVAAQTPAAPAAKPAAKDANAMIDAGAAKAKETASKVGAWVARKKAEHDAKVAARQSAAQLGGAPQIVAPAQAAAK